MHLPSISLFVLALTCQIWLRAHRCQAQAPNLALGKVPVQGNLSTYGYKESSTDGKRYPCQALYWSFPSWLFVDLGSSYVISSVQVTASNPLTNFTVEVSTQLPTLLPGFPLETPSSYVCAREEGTIYGTTHLYYCPIPVVGRYVRVLVTEPTGVHQYNPLTLCEFEVYGPRQWVLEPFDSSVTSSPDILETLSVAPGHMSSLACARKCVRREGQMCKVIQSHRTSGVCQLIGDFHISDTATGPEWEAYKILYYYFA